MRKDFEILGLKRSDAAAMHEKRKGKKRRRSGIKRVKENSENERESRGECLESSKKTGSKFEKREREVDVAYSAVNVTCIYI